MTALHLALEKPFSTYLSTSSKICVLRFDGGQLYREIKTALLLKPDSRRFQDPALVLSRIFHGWSGCLCVTVLLLASTSKPNSS